MPTTPTHALRYPAGTDPANVPADLQNLANDVDAKLTPYSQGVIAARPAFGKAGRRYRATDTGLIYLDIGSAWITEGPIPPDDSVSTAKPLVEAIQTHRDVLAELAKVGRRGGQLQCAGRGAAVARADEPQLDRAARVGGARAGEHAGVAHGA